MIWANNRIHHGPMVVFVCSHVTQFHYHHADVFEDIEPLKILSSVFLRLNQYSQLSVVQYMGLCAFSLPISLMMIVRICIHHLIIIIIKSEVCQTCHCLELCYKTVVCAVCLSTFLRNICSLWWTIRLCGAKRTTTSHNRYNANYHGLFEMVLIRRVKNKTKTI